MKRLSDIVNRAPNPAPWSEGENIPWDDPDFSERMLAEHLSQEHDLASRRSPTIDEHVGWIFSTVLEGRPGRLLDLGCGPGLYARRLLLELQGAELIRKGGEAGPSWYSEASGLFSDRPHLVLQEDFWDAEAAASTNRFMVIDASTGAVSSYALSNETYTEQQLDAVLRTAGFDAVESFPSLSGKDVAGAEDLPVVVARR